MRSFFTNRLTRPTRTRGGHVRRLQLEKLCGRELLAADLQNPGNSLDVDGNLRISPIDALSVINEIRRRRGSGEGVTTFEALTNPFNDSSRYFDVNGDGNTSPIDALQVINDIRRGKPEIAFRLANDTDREGMGQRDQRTFDLGIQGRVNFAGDNPTLFAGVIQDESLQWVDLTPNLASDGSFDLTDRQLRAVLGDVLNQGPFELTFSPDGSEYQRQEMDIELLRSPPQAQLLEHALDEDTPTTLDITAQIYAPDSDMDSISVQIVTMPENGDLIVNGDRYEYQPDDNFFGTDTIVYEVLDGIDTSGPVTLTLSVESVNDLPTIGFVENQTLDANNRSIRIPISAFDLDDSELEYFGFATVPNALYEIRSMFGLNYGGEELHDLTGQNEKWFFGNEGTSFFILPGGELIEWLGEDPDATEPARTIAVLSTDIYDDPQQLSQATRGILAPASVHVDADEVLVVPEEGLIGKILINIAAVDQSDSVVSQFELEIDPPAFDRVAQQNQIDQWIEELAELSLDDTPAFLQSLSSRIDEFDLGIRPELINMLDRLLKNYQQTVQQQLDANDWEWYRRGELESESAQVRWVESQLRTLQENYDAAMDQYDDALFATNPDSTSDPLFVQGPLPGNRATAYVGDNLYLDFHAVHPEEQGFFQWLDGYDEQIHGYMPGQVQNGDFLWWGIPESALGSHTFTVHSEAPSTSRQSSYTFTVDVIAERPESVAPTLQQLSATPNTITDIGTDVITLNARGAWHPGFKLSAVDFYQDEDGDGVFDENVDRLLGRDSTGFDGWKWTGTPLPSAGDDSLAFFAVAEARAPFGASNVRSPAALAEVEVLAVPRLQATTLQLSDDVQSNSDIEDSDSYNTDHVVHLANGQTVVAEHRHTGDDPGIYLTRYENPGPDGRGTPIGSAQRIAVGNPWKFELRGDAVGNMILLASDLGAPYVEGFGQSVVFFRIDADLNLVGDPIVLAQDEYQHFTFTAAMNAAGDGVIAWKPTYAGRPVWVQTMTDGGNTLGEVQTIDLHGGFHDASRWDSTAVNANGDYVVAWEGEALLGNVHSGDSVTVEHGIFPDRVALSDEGRAVLIGWTQELGTAARTIDSNGRVFGDPFPMDLSPNYATYLKTDFVDESTVHLEYFTRPGDSGPRYYHARDLNLLVRPELELTKVTSPSLPQTTPDVGETLSVQTEFTIDSGDSDDASGEPVTLAFHLSHDDLVGREDRLLHSVTLTDGIVAGQTISVDSDLTLPPQSDPFWTRGTTDLFIIAEIVGVGTPAFLTIPSVNIDFADVLASTLVDLGEIQSLTPHAGEAQFDPIPGNTAFINPQAVFDQLYDPGSQPETQVNMLQVLGYQYLAGLEAIATRAPYSLRTQIRELGRDVRGAIDTFELNEAVAEQWGNTQITTAEAARDAARQSAITKRNNDVGAAADAGNATLTENRRQIDDANDSLEQRVSTRTAELDRRIDEIEGDLEGLGESTENIDRISDELDGEGFGLFEKYRKAAQDRLPSVNLQSLAEETRAFFNDLSGHYRGLYLKAKAQLDARLADAREQRDNVRRTVESEINTLTKPLRDANSAILSNWEAVKEGFDEIRDAAIETAEIALDDAKEGIATAVQQMKDAAQDVQELGPLLESGVTQVTAKIEDLSGENGVLSGLQDQLDVLPNLNPVATIEQIGDSVTASIDYAQEVLGDVKSTIGDGVGELNEFGGEFSDWGKDLGGDVAEFVKDNLLSVFTDEIIAYKMETGFDLTLNLGTGSLYVDANIAPGINYDSRKLFDLLEGNVSFPDLDPMEAITSLFGVELVSTNNYDDVRDTQLAEFGATNVYFSSERFVEYFGGETLIGDATELVATGGSSANDAIKDLANQLRLEFDDIFGWLTRKGEEQFEAVVPGLIKALLTQTPFEAPHIELKWTPVTYSYDLEIGNPLGRLADLSPLGGLAPDEILESDYVEELLDGLPLGVDSPHAAFTLVWKIPDGESLPTTSEMDAAIDGYLNDFDFDDFSAPSLTGELIDLAVAELEQQGLPEVALEILGELANVMIGSSPIESVVSQQIADQLDLDLSFITSQFQELKTSQPGHYRLDLRDTPAGLSLADFFDRVTFGNLGEASLDEFSFDLNSLTLKVSGTLCHKHSWGSIADVFGV